LPNRGAEPLHEPVLQQLVARGNRIDRRHRPDYTERRRCFAVINRCPSAISEAITPHSRPRSRRIPIQPPTPTYGGTKKNSGSAATSVSCSSFVAAHQTARRS